MILNEKYSFDSKRNAGGNEKQKPLRKSSGGDGKRNRTGDAMPMGRPVA